MSFYDDASWLLIPSGIEEDIVFAQKPISGLGDLSFTRASDATYTDSTGVVRRSPYNLVTFSEMFSDVAWIKTTTSVTANTITAPNGTLTADTLTASGSFPRVVQNPAVQANQSYRISVYAKSGTASVFTIAVTVNSVVLVNSVQYNLSNGVVTGSGTMQPVGDGWYLCSASFTVGASAANPDIRFFSHAQGVTGGWSGTNFIYGWGAQLVEGTSALDYFPTTNRQDVPRIDFRNADGTLSSCGRLLLEPQRTNSIRNSSMVGAVAGTPGTLPTNWTINTGVTQTIVGSGVENGLPYLDVRFNGTASTSLILLSSESTSGIAASNGQTWTNSFYFKAIASPLPPTSYNVHTVQRASGTNIGSFNLPFTPTSTLARYTQTVTTNQATITHIQPFFFASVTSGQSYDFTIRIAAPQMELGAYATTWVPTTTAAVTRLADAASKTGVSSLIGQTEGTVFFEADIQKRNASEFYFGISTGSALGNALYVYQPSAGALQILIRKTGNADGALNILNANWNAGYNKVAIGYSATSAIVYINGESKGTLSFTDMPACDRITLGGRIDVPGTLVGAGGYSQAALFPTRLTNAELAQLTTL